MYSINDSEKKWQNFWEENNINWFEKDSPKPVYSIDTPPPTVSGAIHIWHIFSYTQAEVIARFKRMVGYNVFYPFGFDDNGLPTEILVEKETGKKASVVWRLEFVQECLNTTARYREVFKKLWQSLWLSVDWTLNYSTISHRVQRISQKSFLRLLKDEIIYKKQAPALRCTKCWTSVAQAEVEDKEFNSVFYDLKFNLSTGEDIIVATTRPELLPACVAVFVNPEDARYTSIIWKEIITPLGKKVKILADEKVWIDKWTWVVMCCSYWDETDMYWIQNYDLPENIIINQYWIIQDTGIAEIDWQKLHAAREIIINRLKQENKVVWEKAITHDVGTHERCGTPMEIINVWQWFIKIMDKKQKLLDMADEINWHPDYMKKRYIDRVQNLKWDWCISRQRFFGIPIPVWYSKKTWEIILPDESQLPIDPLSDVPQNLPAWHTRDDIVADSDVLDTWATSSLTPLVNANWGEENSLEEVILPMDLRPQAHDIIRTWAFYTIVKSMYHRNMIPFKNIMISWHVLAKKWEKISKSKNNAGKWPEQLIAAYGADSLRYWACWWSLGKNVILDEEEIKKWQKLLTKLWNSANFVFKNIEWFDFSKIFDEKNIQPLDKWILQKAQYVADKMTDFLERFEFGLARIEFESFFWRDFCDQYLEIVKDKIYNPQKYEDGEIKKASAQYSLYNTFFAIIKLIAPILPHITEELYQTYFVQQEKIISIHKTSYPKNIVDCSDFENLNKESEKLFVFVDAMRQYKSQNSIKLWEEVAQITISDTQENIEVLKKYADNIKWVSKAWSVEFEIWKDFTISIQK